MMIYNYNFLTWQEGNLARSFLCNGNESQEADKQLRVLEPVFGYD